MHQPRRRLSVDDRRDELLRACLRLLGERPWDEVSMAEVATAAGASKPLLYHYFSTKSDLYLAAVRLAAGELAEATRPDPSLPTRARRTAALEAHFDWIEANDLAYRAVLQGGMSSHREVQAIVETARDEVVRRLADEFGFGELTPAQRIALRGWIGFLEGASLEWLRSRAITKEHAIRLVAASASGVLRAAKIDPEPAETS